MISSGTFKRGAKSGIDTLIELTKVIVPVCMLVTILKHTAILDIIAKVCSPAMKAFGLPGEAAIVLVLGNLLNIYAAIGAMTSITLTAKQAAIIALMLSFSHNLIVETAVSKKIGVGFFFVLTLRLGLAAAAGVILNLVL